jgi:hypothetical protein
MDVNAQGHLVTAATGVSLTAGEQSFTVGNRLRFISFAYCVLKDRRVVLHSTLCDIPDETNEDFLYEVAEAHDAVKVAATMVDDAMEYLREIGSSLDDARTATAEDFLDKLKQELRIGLH